jgi:hypothetical protein
VSLAVINNGKSYLSLFFHQFPAAAGDDLTFLQMQDFVADGAVDIAFLFRPDNGGKAAFQFVFHGIFLCFQLVFFSMGSAT